MVNKVITAL